MRDYRELCRTIAAINRSYPPSTIFISSSVNPYNSYTRLSICWSVASIWRWRMVLSWAVLAEV